MTDLIIKGAGGIKDGLYVIKDGEMFKFKSKGGTVRTYTIVDRPRGERVDRKEEVDGFLFTCVDMLPSVDRPQKVIAQITFDEEKLREIVKEAVERFKEEYEITDRPRGEWNDIGGVIRWGCSLCHYAYDQKFNFCPNCGAK